MRASSKKSFLAAAAPGNAASNRNRQHPGREEPHPGTDAKDSEEMDASVEEMIREQRLRGVRAIAKVGLIACAISIPFCTGIVFFLDSQLGLAMLGIAAVLGIYEARVLFLTSRGRYHPHLDWLGAAIEVSVPTVVALIDAAEVGPAYALTSAPVMLYGLAVLVSALRLRPCLVLFAGGLGAAQMLAVYALLRDRIDPKLLEMLPSIGISNTIQRAAYVFLAGIIGWFLCRSLLRLAHDLSTQWLARQRSERERRTLEEQLHQAQKMEAIGQLAGGVAHDFNNALTTILGYCEFLEDELSEPELITDVQEIRRAGERAVAMTAQLLDFSRKQTFQTKRVDLNTLVSDASRMLEHALGAGMTFEFVPGEGVLSVEVDPNRLEQVLVNLVINARDAMPGGGTVTIETGRASADAWPLHTPKADGIFLTVSDTGEGIAPEVQTRLFEPFFTTKEQGKGTGLGLATAYGAVKQFRGNLSVESTRGKGSTFKILLPACELQPEPVASQARPSLEGNGETVLVVEDEGDLRRFAVRVLQRAGYNVLSAEHAEAAMETATRFKETIHLLLTDVVMPGRTGKELWESLRPLRPAARVLFMSGYAQNILGEHVSLGKDTPLLSKPFTAAELERKVRETLNAPLPGPLNE